MDIYGSRKAWEKQHSASDTTRPPLVPAEKNNAGIATRRPRTMEVSSRYRSPTPTKSRRCPSPSFTRTVSSSSQLVPKRATSAERKRPSTPPSPTSLSTPIRDASIELPVSSRRLSTGRLPESLWPSTMRSLNVSFQSDTISIPVSKKEKPVSSSSIDRTLRPSSNVAPKQGGTPFVSRKPTPERKKSPLKGKDSFDQRENSRPVDGARSRLMEQHRWPSRIDGKISPSSLNRSLDLAEKSNRSLSPSTLGMGRPSMRRMSLPLYSGSKLLQKTCSDTARLLSLKENGGLVSPTKSEDEILAPTSGPHRLLSASSLDRTTLATAVSRLYPLSSSASRSAPPRKTTFSSSSSIARGMSPSRGPSPSRGLSPLRGTNPSCSRSSTPPSRGVSPSRVRQTSNSTQSSSSTSVLSFMADVKKGKKASYIDDVHQLRLLYNRYLQWRFANAQAEAVMYIEKLTAEETLYNVWCATSELQDLVTSRRSGLQQFNLEIKLNSVLNKQMEYLEVWAILETDHINSLAGAIDDLEANTLRLPVTGGTKADVESLKAAMSSALDVMQSMGSSILFLLSKVEEMNKLVSELAVVTSKETSMLGKCEDLVATTAVMQIEECSLRTHLIQMKQEETDETESANLILSKFQWP